MHNRSIGYITWFLNSLTCNTPLSSPQHPSSLPTCYPKMMHSRLQKAQDILQHRNVFLRVEGDKSSFVFEAGAVEELLPGSLSFPFAIPDRTRMGLTHNNLVSEGLGLITAPDQTTSHVFYKLYPAAYLSIREADLRDYAVRTQKVRFPPVARLIFLIPVIS